MLKTYLPSGPLAGSLIRLSGPDAQDFLHRITTMNVRALSAGQGGPGCLLNPQGRFRAYFHLWNVLPGEYAFEVPIGQGGRWKQEFLAAIDQYTFAEKITLKEETGLECAWVFGMTAATVDVAYSFTHADAEFSRPWRSVWATDIRSWLSRHATGAVELSETDVELWRLQSLRPRVDHEITFEANPLELGLKEAISDNKGCYPGQEVIEKIVALGSPARRLVRLEGEGEPPVPGTALLASGSEAGKVTSAIRQANGFLALAVVRKTQAQPGLSLDLPDARRASITEVSKYV